MVALLLAALAACSDDDPPEVTRPDVTEPARSPALAEHWHMAYGVFVCDRYLEPLTDQRGDARGIHTHEDGLIHIHPTTEEATGDGAVLGLFAEEVGLGLEDGSLTLPDGSTYEDGDDCGAGPGTVRVLRWDGPDDASADVHEEDLGSIPLRDGEVVAVVFAPDDVEVSQPPSVTGLQNPVDVAPPG